MWINDKWIGWITCWALQYGRTRVTHKEVYDLARHKSPIAQWLERPTGIWKVIGSTPVGDSEYFDLRALLRYLHFIQVTNPFIIYFCYYFLNYSSPYFIDLPICKSYCLLISDSIHCITTIQNRPKCFEYWITLSRFRNRVMHSDFFLFSFGHFEDVRLAAIDCLVDLTKSEGFFVIFSLP